MKWLCAFTVQASEGPSKRWSSWRCCHCHHSWADSAFLCSSSPFSYSIFQIIPFALILKKCVIIPLIEIMKTDSFNSSKNEQQWNNQFLGHSPWTWLLKADTTVSFLKFPCLKGLRQNEGSAVYCIWKGLVILSPRCVQSASANLSPTTRNWVLLTGQLELLNHMLEAECAAPRRTLCLPFSRSVFFLFLQDVEELCFFSLGGISPRGKNKHFFTQFHNDKKKGMCPYFVWIWDFP